jgi:hypothetical protein
LKEKVRKSDEPPIFGGRDNQGKGSIRGLSANFPQDVVDYSQSYRKKW